MIPHSDELIVGISDSETPARLSVSGEIDIDTYEQFKRVISEAAARPDPVIVDLTGVRFLGSIGIHVLLENHSRLHSVQARAGSVVARALTLVGFPKLTAVTVR